MDDYGLLDVVMVLFAVQIVRIYVAPFKKEVSVHNPWRYAVWVVYIIFQYLVMISDAEHPLLILVTNIILVTLIQITSASGELKTALFRSGIFYASWMAVEVITQNILLLMGTDGEYFFTVGNIISKIAMYLIVQVHGRWSVKENGAPLSLRHWAKLFLVPASSICIIYGAYMLTLQGGMYAAFSAVSVLMLLINYVIFDVYEKMSTQALMEKQNTAYEQEIRLCVRQAAEREEAYRQTRVLRHDINDRLVAVSALVREGKQDEAAEALGKMIRENSLLKREIAHSGNLALDALVNYKYSAALAEGVVMECCIEVPAELSVDGTDLCIILGNLLDNALEAVRFLPEKERKMDLTVRLSKGVLLIAVENPYTGTISVDGHGRIRSNKAGDHGIGLVSVERTAAKYDGEVIFRYDGGVFKASVMLCVGELLHVSP